MTTFHNVLTGFIGKKVYIVLAENKNHPAVMGVMADVGEDVVQIDQASQGSSSTRHTYVPFKAIVYFHEA